MAIPNDSFLNASEEQEVTFLSGFNSSGELDGTSYFTWNGNNPPTYNQTSSKSFKYGGGSPTSNGTPSGPNSTAGSPGGTVTYSFGSGFSSVAQTAIQAALQIWSDETSVQFTQASSGTAAINFVASTSGGSQSLSTFYLNPIGSTQVDAPANSTITLNTSTTPITDNFADGGASFGTIEHEIGHSLGLGHAGPYGDSIADTQNNQLTAYDQRLY